MAAVVLCAACVVTGLGAEAPSLTLMTWNVRNYNATHRQVDGSFRPDYPKPEAAKAALRAVLLRRQPDILLLQEMGPPGYLLELQRDLARDGLAYPDRFLAKAVDTERHLAVLTRVPFLQRRVHADLTFGIGDRIWPVKRGMLEVVFLWEGQVFRLFGIHLKSAFGATRADPDWAARRTGEARALRNRILERQPDPGRLPFLVAGDFNATVDQAPVRRFLERGQTLLAAWTPANDSRGETWTYRHERSGTYRRVDLILRSPGFDRAFRIVEARIPDEPEVRRASDHRPVFIRFELR